MVGWHPTDWGIIGILIFCLVLGLGTYSFRQRPVRFGLGIATMLIVTALLGTQDSVLTRERSFFGVNTVQRTETGDYHLLVHGRTIPATFREIVKIASILSELSHFWIDFMKGPMLARLLIAC